MNIDSVVTFLTTLEPDVNHQFYWSGIHPDSRRIQAYGSLEEMLPRLVERNQEGFGIFVCVNAIDKPAYDGGYPRRRSSDVTRVRAVFADWDTPNKPVPKLPIVPTMAVQTSEGKYHFYWCVDDLPLDQFESVQRGITQALGSDGSVVDLSREMRVPGFDHTKVLEVRHEVLLLMATGRRYLAGDVSSVFPYSKAAKFSTWDGSIRSRSTMTAAIVAHLYGPPHDGKFWVPCPWAENHTTPDTPSGTAYYPPAEENGGKGWFKCMHAHCQERYADAYDEWISQKVAGALC